MTHTLYTYMKALKNHISAYLRDVPVDRKLIFLKYLTSESSVGNTGSIQMKIILVCHVIHVIQ